MSDDLVAFLRSLRPVMQEAKCCSWSIGAHYNRDGTVGGDLVPPHEPVIDPDSGVVILDYKSLRARLAQED